MMRQVDLIHMKPLPPPPPPEDNIITITETITMVEEYHDEDDILHERPTAKEITVRTWYCEHAEFDSKGFCYGCSGEPTYGDKITCASIDKNSDILTGGDTHE